MKAPARLLLVPALAAALTLSACGTTATPGSSDSSASATATPSKPETAQELLTRLETAAGQAESVAMKMTGDTLRGSGEARLGSDPAASFVFDTGDSNTLLVLVDEVLYSKDGADSSARWTATPAEEVGLVDSFTPKGMFSAMRAGAKSVTNKGPEDLQGTPTTKYELSVDTAAAEAGAGATPSPGSAEAIFTIWVDKDDLLRRISVPAEGSTVVVDYSGWGDPVEVVAPPADQVDQSPLN